MSVGSDEDRPTTDFTAKDILYVWGSDMWAALQRSESARRNGDNTALNLTLNSLLNFGLMRFSKCRQSARLTLAIEPNSPIARELLVLSWLVWFPPFLVGHLFLFVSCLTRRYMKKFGEFVVLLVLFCAGLAIAQIAASIYKMFAALTYPAAFVAIALCGLYSVYVAMSLGSIAKWLMPLSQRNSKSE